MGVSKSQLFTSSGTWTAPAGVSSAKITQVGGGAGGGPGQTGFGGGGGGGGAGEFCRRRTIVVTPGADYTITIGAGGTSVWNGTQGTRGGTTSFDTLVKCDGGWGGTSQDCAGNTHKNSAKGGGYNGLTPESESGGGNSCGRFALAGLAESPTYYGGASGCGPPIDGGTTIIVGAPCEGNNGGAGGAGSANMGAGGAASCFGVGGDGGRENFAEDGHPPPAGSYGAGGGGCGEGDGVTHIKGGDGRGGACMVEWIG